MATTHREGSVFHHKGETITHYETGSAPEAQAEPVTEPIPATVDADQPSPPPVKPAKATQVKPKAKK